MGNIYSLSELMSTAYSMLCTKLAYPNARLIRRPVYVRGRKYLEYREGLTTGHSCRFDLAGEAGEKTLIIGKNCQLGDNTHIVAHKKVVIGDDFLAASKVFISDTNHGNYGENGDSPDIPPNQRRLVWRDVRIGNRVWAGENVVILPGSVIGDGSIIGANSVVKGEIPSECIAAGAPAKVVKMWDGSAKKWVKTKETQV